MIRLLDTTGNAVASAIAGERHRMGSPTVGMVLTLLVLAEESAQSDAASAAAEAAREHPMRILVLVPRPGRETRLDAEISVGGDDGPGELAVLRLRGELAQHAGAVAIPLLLPDTPVVAWWPGQSPPHEADDPIGRHAQRRISDAAEAADAAAALASRRAAYAPGDTDLAWTRLTPWRTLLASLLDQPFEPLVGAEVEVERGNPSGPLLASWLRLALGVPVTSVATDGPGLTAVRLRAPGGDLLVSRPDGRVAQLQMPGQPPSTVALPRRDTSALLAEELRRLDADDVYGEVLAALADDDWAPEP